MSASARVMVFIDGSNVFWGLKNYRTTMGPLAIDYAKLVSLVSGPRQVRGSHYYCSQPAVPSEGQTKFIDMLRQSGISVTAKTLKMRRDSSGQLRAVEKGVDVALVTDLLSFAWEMAYDDAVLVSGDADYTGAVEKVKSKGRMVDVVAWRESLSRELKLVASKVVYIDDIVDKIRLVESTSSSSSSASSPVSRPSARP
ncbi:MAG TPA: NYN domain-containing protein [Candidatus Sulfotelmatobacter sp.]|jgi:uncharacterized LabA/DUF88 family protein|nr:NYN domain-containing protein [Candidatus Sulfotelmatobacter sp.]